MTLLCPKIEKARTGKTAGSETMGDKLGLFTLVGFFIVLLQVRERERKREVSKSRLPVPLADFSAG